MWVSLLSYRFLDLLHPKISLSGDSYSLRATSFCWTLPDSNSEIRYLCSQALCFTVTKCYAVNATATSIASFCLLLTLLVLCWALLQCWSNLLLMSKISPLSSFVWEKHDLWHLNHQRSWKDIYVLPNGDISSALLIAMAWRGWTLLEHQGELFSLPFLHTSVVTFPLLKTPSCHLCFKTVEILEGKGGTNL